MKSALVSPKNANYEGLKKWVQERKLFALVDPFFELPHHENSYRLDLKDTDPVFYDLIAWDQESYETPYLIQLNLENLDWLLNTLSTERWGVFFVSNEKPESLARHFQKFVIARGPDHNPYFLRFHDASVLEVLLSTWSPREREVFFGSVDHFGIPNLDTMDVTWVDNGAGAPMRVAPRPEECLMTLESYQLKACGEAIDRDLVKVIYWHLRNYHARCVQHVPKKRLEARITIGIDKARSYGLSTISDLAGFTALMFELAPNFDEHPSFRRVLVDITTPPETKMKRLSQVITDREWEEALQLYDRAFWQKVLPKK